MTAPRTKFDVIVPAHNEERGIMATVLNLAAVDYPASLRRVIVVADNCTDATASRASEAGAMVLVRNDMSRRGKGYALAHAFERSLNEGFADAVVVVDADTKVTANLLGSFDARMCRGARAIQAEYKVANPESSWRTRLMHIGFTLFHDVRSRGRERLGVSAGLRGNGMAFSAPLLREIPHEAFSIVEDVEYGLRLGLAGHRIEYAGEAKVFGEMVSSEVSSRSQRRRWEGGRLALARRHATRLLVEGARRRSLMLLDLAADLLVPPLTYIVLAAALGLAASLVWLALGRGAWCAVVPWCAAWVGLAAYLARGLMLARAGPRVMVDLLWAPLYMVWKVVLAIRAPPRADEEWIRTAREEEKR
jgi:cellulose synthase/poly-beta-1,6-N-acetylglucosamine synthase-like glycosyltransferase